MFLQECFFERSFTHCRPALLLHWAPRHIPPPLGTDWQVGISWLSICPVHCPPSWQRPIVAGSGQPGPVFAAPSAQSRAGGAWAGGSRSSGGGGCKSCPFELQEEPCSPPEQGLGRPRGSRTACTALGRCCCEVSGMGSGPADGNRFDLGINGEALRAPTAPIQATRAVPPRPEGTRDPLGSGAS